MMRMWRKAREWEKMARNIHHGTKPILHWSSQWWANIHFEWDFLRKASGKLSVEVRRVSIILKGSRISGVIAKTSGYHFMVIKRNTHCYDHYALFFRNVVCVGTITFHGIISSSFRWCMYGGRSQWILARFRGSHCYQKMMCFPHLFTSFCCPPMLNRVPCRVVTCRHCAGHSLR